MRFLNWLLGGARAKSHQARHEPLQASVPPEAKQGEVSKPPVQRVTVGRCEACGRELRVKASGARPEMRLTCKCGHVAVVKVDPTLLPGPAQRSDRPASPRGHREGGAAAAITAALAQEIGHSGDDVMLHFLHQLCAAYAENDEVSIAKLEPAATLIGQELNRRGGIREMRRVWEQLGNVRGARTLDMHWDGIGDWRG